MDPSPMEPSFPYRPDGESIVWASTLKMDDDIEETSPIC